MSKKNKKAPDGTAAAETKAKAKKEKKQKGRVQNVFGHPIRNMIVAAVASLLIGLAFILKPYEVSQYCGYGVGGLFAVVGLVYIILYFCHKPISGEYRSEFAIGLLALFAGAYVALSGMITGGTGVGYVLAVRILGILVLGDGLLKLQYSVDIARMKFSAWWVVLIFAVLGLGVGVLTTTDFTTTAIGARTSPASFLYGLGSTLGLVSDKGNYNNFYSGMTMLGIGFCVNAVLDLAAMTVIAIRNHKARREEAIAEGTAMVAAVKQEELDEVLPVSELPENVVVVPAPEPAAIPVAEPVIPAPATAPEAPVIVEAAPEAPDAPAE